jgi:hypothetical protein
MEMVIFHHNPNHYSHFKFEASILHFADVLSNIIQMGSSEEQTVSPKLQEEA